MFEIPTFIILFAMMLALVSAIIGRTVYDKILAVNIFGTVTVLFIALFGFLSKRPDFLDIALVYALINFISTCFSSYFKLLKILFKYCPHYFRVSS